MSEAKLTYAAVTPARNDRANLGLLAACLTAQTVRPESWTIVDDGSKDGTGELARELAKDHPWVPAVTLDPVGMQARGGPVLLAFPPAAGALTWPQRSRQQLPEYGRFVERSPPPTRTGVLSTFCRSS